MLRYVQNLSSSQVAAYYVKDAKAKVSFPGNSDPLITVKRFVEKTTRVEVRGKLSFMQYKNRKLCRVVPRNATEFFQKFDRNDQLVFVIAPPPMPTCEICKEIPLHEPLLVRVEEHSQQQFFFCGTCSTNTTFVPVVVIPKPMVDWCDDCGESVRRGEADNCINPYNLAGHHFEICTSCVNKRCRVSQRWPEELDSTGIGLPKNLF